MTFWLGVMTVFGVVMYFAIRDDIMWFEEWDD